MVFFCSVTSENYIFVRCIFVNFIFQEAALRSRERRIRNTDYVMTENHRLNNLKQSVDDEWNHVMSEQKNIERLVEKNLE